MTRAILLLAVTAFAFACGETDADTTLPPTPKHPQGGAGGAAEAGAGGSDDTAAIDAAVNAFCAASYGQFTTTFDGCCSDTDRGTAAYVAATNFLISLKDDCTSLVAGAAEQDHVELVDDAEEACVAAFQSATAAVLACNGTATDPTELIRAACSGAVVGQQQAGDPCTHAFECADGLACVPVDAVMIQGRVCGDPPKEGEPCGFELAFPFGNHPRCASGLFCRADATCATPAADGGTCDTDRGCTNGFCVQGQCASHPAGPTEPCASTHDCAPGTYCAGGAIAMAPGDGGAGGDDGAGGAPPPMGTCAAQKTAGAPCATSDECSGICDPTTHQCAAFCGKP